MERLRPHVRISEFLRWASCYASSTTDRVRPEADTRLTASPNPPAKIKKMLERIRTLLRPSAPASESRIGSGGFVYVTETEPTALRDVSVGAIVRNANAGPPWIVVNHSLASVCVSRWPGRLLRVEIVEKAKEQPMAYANYTRASAVAVIEELPAHSLLGEYGGLLADIIDQIDKLTLDDAFGLSEALQPASLEIYSTAWKNWLAKIDANSVYLDVNHEDTLQIKAEREVSPVGYALSLVSSMVLTRGKAVSGQAAITVDAEGDVELQAPWSGATTALLHAAMAVGAPNLLTPQEAEILKTPWKTKVRGPSY